MTRKFPHASSPITIGRTTFRNRIFSAPMGGTDITNDGCIGPKSTAFYELRAKGGAAAVTVSELMVHPQTDGSHAYHLDESILNSLAAATYTADAIRRHGAIPSLELSHSGQFAGTYMTDKSRQHGLCQWGPSDGIRADGVPVKALTQELIDDIVKAYGHAAGLAKRAGFEMVMIHGGHGWLINQFLSPLFNHRSDSYGGSLENRVRFAVEVLQSVRAAVGPFFPIEFRMSGAEFTEGGYGLEEGIQIAQAIEAYADIIHVSAGTYQKTFDITHPPCSRAPRPPCSPGCGCFPRLCLRPVRPALRLPIWQGCCSSRWWGRADGICAWSCSRPIWCCSPFRWHRTPRPKSMAA